MRDRPAWRLCDLAQPRLPVEPVDLVDDAVDVERQVGTFGFDLAIDCECRRRPFDPRKPLGDRKAPAAQFIDDLCLGLTRHDAGFAPAMREEPQRPARGDARVLLAQRSGGGVARIGELPRVLAGFLRHGEQARVERGEVVFRHVDLAANLEDRRRFAVQLLRNVADGSHIGGDVFADLTIAAGQRLHEASLFIPQRTRQPVDLRLRGQRNRRILR